MAYTALVTATMRGGDQIPAMADGKLRQSAMRVLLGTWEGESDVAILVARLPQGLKLSSVDAEGPVRIARIGGPNIF